MKSGKNLTVIVLVLAAVIAAVLGVGYIVKTWHSAPTSGQTAQDKTGAPGVGAGTPKLVGCAWSNVDDPRQAVQEAVSKALSEIGSNKPVYAFVTSTSGYDQSVVWDELRKALPPEVKIHGATSAFGVMTKEGFHTGNVGALAILLVASTNVNFGVASVDLEAFSQPKKAGKELMLQAYKNAGVPETVRPKLIIMTGTRARADQVAIMDGIAEVVGVETPVVGGDAADDQNTGGWRQYTRETLHKNGLGVVITAIFTEANTGWAFESGFRITDKEGVVTRAEGKVIYEINNRPALEVYNEWLNGHLYEAIEAKDFYGIVQFTGQNPLCKVLKGKDGQIGYVTSHPLPNKENLADKSLPVASAIEKGSTVRMFAGTWQTILNRAENLPTSAMIHGGIKADQGLWGIVFFCRGASRIIPPSELPKVPLLVNNTANGLPFVGLITSGEQGPIPGLRNVHANLAECMVIIGE